MPAALVQRIGSAQSPLACYLVGVNGVVCYQDRQVQGRQGRLLKGQPVALAG